MDYAALLELMRTRRSVRRFREQPLRRDQIECLVEAARWAPSNENRQGWKFIVFDRREAIRALADRVRSTIAAKTKHVRRLLSDRTDEMAHHAALFAGAACVMLVMHKRPAALAMRALAGVPNAELVSGEALSAAMAVENLLLAAHAMGLGACAMTGPLAAHEAIAEIPDLPAGFEPTCLVAVGHADEDPAPPRRKKIEHLIEYR